MAFTVFTHSPQTDPSTFATGDKFDTVEQAQKFAIEELTMLTGQAVIEASSTQFETEKMWATIWDYSPSHRVREHRNTTMEQTPDEQYTSTSSGWKVGDLLVVNPNTRYDEIVVGVDEYLILLRADGYAHQAIHSSQSTNIRKRNTGLDYTFTTFEQLHRHFEKGYFTPYFELF